MPYGMLAGVFAIVLAVQVAETRGCPADSPSTSPAPATPAPNTPPGDVFTTTDGVRFIVEPVVTNLEIPWSMAFAPDGRLFVTERPGRVRIVNLAARTSELALTLDDVYTEGEAGLLGLALDPQFAQTRLVYLYYSARTGRSAPSTASSGTAKPRRGWPSAPCCWTASRRRRSTTAAGSSSVLTACSTSPPVTRRTPVFRRTWDRWPARFSGSTATARRLGTIRSVRPCTRYGHRNPQGLDWHPVTGQLWAVEHGNVGNDEVNAIDAGANYGWPRIEGSQAMAGMRTPLTFYNPAIAPSGTSFYRGDRFPRFVNNVFTGTLRGTHLLRLIADGSAPRIASQEVLLNGRFGRLRDVVPGPDGFLYLATNNRDGRGSPAATDDRILRISPAP